jgi:hypothetical protein
MTGYTVTRRACIIALMTAMPACAGVAAIPQSGVPPTKGNPMSNPSSAPSYPSPPHVVPIEHAGVRYEQDEARQSEPDAGRGGWLVARDAANGRQLWSLQLYADPYDAASPVGSPPRWFQSMVFTAGAAGIEIEDDIGTLFLVDLGTRAVTVRQSPSLSPNPRSEDRRPKFD